MHEIIIRKFFTDWDDEIVQYLTSTDILCVALFDNTKKLLYATSAMQKLFKTEPSESIINPTLDKLISIESTDSLVFQGWMTIGDYISFNNTIVAHVYKKEGKLLIIGGVEAPELMNQYIAMQQLNQQINNLQRELVKEKVMLEKTLNQLNKTNEELNQLNASKDKFFSIISHDLKSPFNSILGFSELLHEQIKNKDYSEIELYSELVNKSATKAFDLLMNLMEWSRSQTGRITYNPESFDIVETILEMISLFQEIAEQKNIQILSSLPPQLIIFADKAMINTIFRNLISNAIKFTPMEGSITVSIVENEHHYLFSVRDSGIGIPKDQIYKLFRIDEHYTTKGTNQETGTGLGLILCKEFVEKHSGQIWVESEEGKGSTFSFTIPIS